MHIYANRTLSGVVLWLALAAPAMAQVAINQAKAKAGLGGCDETGFSSDYREPTLQLTA